MISPTDNFPKTSNKFKYIHIDTIEMLYSSVYRYCLTEIDRYSRKSYNAKANGMIERHYRKLKAAIR